MRFQISRFANENVVVQYLKNEKAVLTVRPEKDWCPFFSMPPSPAEGL